MSSPAEFYNSLPPISKAYGTLCLLATTAFHLGLYDPWHYGLVFKRFQEARTLLFSQRMGVVRRYFRTLSDICPTLEISKRLVSRWRIGAPPIQRAEADDWGRSGAFRGRSYRLNE